MGVTATLDRPTGKYFCRECFEPTLEVQLAAASADIEWARVGPTYSFNNISNVVDEGETDDNPPWAVDIVYETEEVNDNE